MHAAYATAKSARRGRRLRRWILALLLLTALGLIVERNLRAVILSLASAKAYAYAAGAINQAGEEVMRGVEAETILTHVLTNEQGEVTLIESNTLAMNAIASQVASRTEELLSFQDNSILYVPLLSVTGSGFLSGLGPRVPVRVLPVGAVQTMYESEFQTAGINQTRHKTVLLVTCKVYMVIPTGSKTVTVAQRMVVAENIIVGKVPDSFTDVNNEDDMLNLLP